MHYKNVEPPRETPSRRKPRTEKYKNNKPAKIVIDMVDLKKLASMHCTYPELARFFGCSVDLLQKYYQDVIDRERENTRHALRRAQFKSALDGNIQMQIWLGKQMLGQRDEKTVSVAGEVNNSIKIEFINQDAKQLENSVKNVYDVDVTETEDEGMVAKLLETVTAEDEVDIPIYEILPDADKPTLVSKRLKKEAKANAKNNK